MFLFALLLVAQRVDSPYPPDPPCADYSTYGMAQCLQKQALVWDKRLNNEYARALKRVSLHARPSPMMHEHEGVGNVRFPPITDICARCPFSTHCGL